MLLLIEKVILLKSQDFFAEAPEESLAELAATMAERTVATGDTICAQGDRDARLYVIVEGRVRLHIGDHVVQTLEPGDMFGELALLSGGAQLASGTALTDGLLLSLDREPFDELVADHSGIARHIIGVLARRLQRAPSASRPTRLKDDVLGRLQERLVQRGQEA